jgi:hypothetical protein
MRKRKWLAHPAVLGMMVTLLALIVSWPLAGQSSVSGQETGELRR